MRVIFAWVVFVSVVQFGYAADLKTEFSAAGAAIQPAQVEPDAVNVSFGPGLRAADKNLDIDISGRKLPQGRFGFGVKRDYYTWKFTVGFDDQLGWWIYGDSLADLNLVKEGENYRLKGFIDYDGMGEPARSIDLLLKKSGDTYIVDGYGLVITKQGIYGPNAPLVYGKYKSEKAISCLAIFSLVVLFP